MKLLTSIVSRTNTYVYSTVGQHYAFTSFMFPLPTSLEGNSDQRTFRMNYLSSVAQE